MQEWSEAELRQKLSARQYEVLSLVARHLSSKEIGVRLGLSYKTIDNHVADLLMKLGVSSRADAARIFLDISTHRERLPSTSQGLDPAARPGAQAGQPEQIATFGEDQAQSSTPRTVLPSQLRLPPVGGPRHDLTLVQRIMAMGQIGLVAIAVLAAIVTIMIGILNLLGR
ncbi:MULTISPECIES: helix-turn-helix transcriptional regulator [unclassified Novosphingobium]|uniref:helix-turn-helix domain-containing protein n=1 Tax=unclassified Novosphingobium TaxID=2644732 RepID=UPI00135C4C0D|nr:MULTISPECIES: helix-turn-helix transcriptional regulator [unclassified Novosphingobium]